MKDKKKFFGFSPSCLGRAMVALILSIEPLVVVSLVPRPHLYWSGYEANLISCLTNFRKKSSCCGNWSVKCCVSWMLLKSRPKDDYYKLTRYCVRVYYRSCPQCGANVHVARKRCVCGCNLKNGRGCPEGTTRLRGYGVGASGGRPVGTHSREGVWPQPLGNGGATDLQPLRDGGATDL